MFDISVLSLASSSQGPVHINAPTSAAFVYGAASTAYDMATLSTNGAGFHAIVLNSSELLISGVNGATFSTST